MKSSAIALSSLALAAMSSAIHLPIQRVRPRSGTGSTPMQKTSGAGLDNTQNILYTADVTVGGKTYTLQLDTGSSDLWFAPDKDYNQTFATAQVYESLQANLTYGTGWAAGEVAQIDIDFAGFSIKNQSFLLITALSEWDVQFEEAFPIYQGIAGLSFDTISQVNKVVRKATNDTWGRSLISSIFLSDPSTPNHIAFFLDRTGDLNDTDVGLFDIGTYAAGYESIANQPKHEVFSGLPENVIQWNVLIGEISINGTKQELISSVVADGSTQLTNVPPAGSISALLDTGTSAAQLPAAAFKALYEGMGGVLVNGTSTYVVPCMAEANLEITIGNLTVAVHPLDLTKAQAEDDGNGNKFTICTSAYDPSEYGGADNDMILGDAFLRNVYALYNYGDFVTTESGSSYGTPFVQLLPLTDSQKASAEFKEARAKDLASLPPQIDVTTINDPIPKTIPGTGTGSGVGSSSGSTGSGSTGSGSNLSSSLSNDALSSPSTSDDSSALASLKTLANLAPIALGLLGASVALLIVLIIVVGVAFSRLSKQKAMPTRAGGAYVPVALEREREVEYKDEAVKYDTPFRD